MVTIVNAGIEGTAKLQNGFEALDPFNYVAVGSGSTPEAQTDTTLDTELTTGGFIRAVATVSIFSNYFSKWEIDFTNTSGSSVIVREAAIFNAATDGSMLLRHVWPSDNVVPNGDTARLSIFVLHARA
jgi:hypothetical protein